jgi:pimeloyl-ACP methyl ester carboxylesterase
MSVAYTTTRTATSSFVAVRGLRYHLLQWGDASLASLETPPLVLVHGWMDVAASYQFVVDALAQAEGPQRWIIALDWRGFGHTDTPQADTYWFPDYVADLDAVLDAVSPDAPVDLIGHSMGGNVVMSYAGVRQARIRRLVNLEGFGLPRSEPHQAPGRLLKWLDELKTPQSLRSYESLAGVAERLMKNNPRLSADKAAWLAPHWSAQQADGRFHILGNPAHKLSNPVLYRAEEIVETWKRITAALLWVEGAQTDMSVWWGNRYPRSEFEARLAHVPQVQRVMLENCGHMLHHDQPQRLAEHLLEFLS